MQIQTIQRHIDYYKKFTPLNYQEEYDSFFHNISKKKYYNPQFIYNDPFNKKKYLELQNKFKTAPTNKITKEFYLLYNQIASLLISWNEQDYELFTNLSGQLFGSIKQVSLKDLEQLYGKLTTQHTEVKQHTAQAVVKKLQSSLHDTGILDWKIVLSPANHSEVSIYELEKKILINPHFEFSNIDIDRIICHEIQGHAFQTLNAFDNKAYKTFFTSYLGTEIQYEGLAIFTEVNLLETNLTLQAIKRYLLFMIGNKIALEGTFYEVYDYIYKLTKDKEFSFMTAYRSKRGFSETNKHGCFQKENSYLIGALKIIDLVDQDKKNYFKLIQGSFPLSALPYLNNQKNSDVLVAIKQFNTKNMEFFYNYLSPVLHS